MLQKQYRLTVKGDFVKVFKGNLRARSGPFYLMCHKNNLPCNRFGFVVSSVVSKKATQRNKLRRRLHEIVRYAFSIFTPGYDCVIRAYPGATELQYDAIKRSVEEMFEKVGIIDNKL